MLRRSLTSLLLGLHLLTFLWPKSALAEPSDVVLRAMVERDVLLLLDDGQTLHGKLVGHDESTLVLIESDGSVVTIDRARVSDLRGVSHIPQSSSSAPEPSPPEEARVTPEATPAAQPPTAPAIDTTTQELEDTNTALPAPAGGPLPVADQRPTADAPTRPLQPSRAELKKAGAALFPVFLATFGSGLSLLMLHEAFVLSDGPSFHIGFSLTMAGAGTAALGIPLAIAGSAQPSAPVSGIWIRPVLGVGQGHRSAAIVLTIR